MNEIVLSISGQTPSHKNSKQIARFRNWKTALINNKRYLAWRGSAIAQIQGQTDARGLEGVKIEASFFVQDRRRRDLDNMLASVLDVLAESSVIADDNVFVVKKVTAEFSGVDRENPRAWLTIRQDSDPAARGVVEEAERWIDELWIDELSREYAPLIADSAMHDKLKIRARILRTAVDALLERGL